MWTYKQLRREFCSHQGTQLREAKSSAQNLGRKTPQQFVQTKIAIASHLRAGGLEDSVAFAIGKYSSWGIVCREYLNPMDGQ